MDRISKAQKADVLTQFSEMKFNEGVISERKRIASIISQNDDWCRGYALSWLEIAIDNFKKQNEKVHIIEGCMTMEEFILKYAKEKLSKIIKC